MLFVIAHIYLQCLCKLVYGSYRDFYISYDKFAMWELKCVYEPSRSLVRGDAIFNAFRSEIFTYIFGDMA